MIAKLRMRRSGVMEPEHRVSTAPDQRDRRELLRSPDQMTAKTRYKRLLRRHDHGHLPAFHPRHLLDFGVLLEVVPDPHQDVHSQLLMRQLAPAEPHGHLDLVAFLDEFDHAAHFYIVIVVVDARAKLYFLDLDDFLLFASFVFLFLLFVFELAEIEDFANRRIGAGRDLDEVQAGIGSHCERFTAPDNPYHPAALVDKADAQNGDLLVDARPLAGGGHVHWWSGYVDSPLGS